LNWLSWKARISAVPRWTQEKGARRNAAEAAPPSRWCPKTDHRELIITSRVPPAALCPWRKLPGRTGRPPCHPCRRQQRGGDRESPGSHAPHAMGTARPERCLAIAWWFLRSGARALRASELWSSSSVLCIRPRPDGRSPMGTGYACTFDSHSGCVGVRIPSYIYEVLCQRRPHRSTRTKPYPRVAVGTFGCAVMSRTSLLLARTVDSDPGQRKQKGCVERQAPVTAVSEDFCPFEKPKRKGF
jgi:hypothetical protein